MNLLWLLMHILVLVRWPSQEAVVCCCYCFYRNIFILLLISLLCNCQRLLGDPVTKQICVFPRRGNDPRTTVGIRTCLWSVMFIAIWIYIFEHYVFLYCRLCLFCIFVCFVANFALTYPWSSFVGSYFVHLNVLCFCILCHKLGFRLIKHLKMTVWKLSFVKD